MSSLLMLAQFGQSYWLDDLTRAMLANGELRKRVTDSGLRGVTSNPAIFHKAIVESSDYDNEIAQSNHCPVVSPISVRTACGFSVMKAGPVTHGWVTCWASSWTTIACSWP